MSRVNKSRSANSWPPACKARRASEAEVCLSFVVEVSLCHSLSKVERSNSSSSSRWAKVKTAAAAVGCCLKPVAAVLLRMMMMMMMATAMATAATSHTEREQTPTRSLGASWWHCKCDTATRARGTTGGDIFRSTGGVYVEGGTRQHTDRQTDKQTGYRNGGTRIRTVCLVGSQVLGNKHPACPRRQLQSASVLAADSHRIPCTGAPFYLSFFCFT